MKIYIVSILLLCMSCSKGGGDDTPVTPTPPASGGGGGGGTVETALVNTTHLDALTTPVIFPNGNKATAVYIYSNAPGYTPVEAQGEGYTCVDDVSRAVLFYTRSSTFSTDNMLKERALGMIRFVLNMQSANGYFYNFLYSNGTINQYGVTSANTAKWWSWRALQALTEAEQTVRSVNQPLADSMAAASAKLVATIKADLFNKPLTSTVVDGISIPDWLPEGADQAATLILALVPYATKTNDAEVKDYIKKLADGVVQMQQGNATQFPYSVILSSGTAWHAYGSDQSHALFAAGSYLNIATYTNTALAEVDNFYAWLLSSGMKSSFRVRFENGLFTPVNVLEFEQIAYGIRPMVFAAMDAYAAKTNEKYADMAGHLAAWFLGSNSASTIMYSTANGICFDAINNGNAVNRNSGAESTIEALLTMQRVNTNASVKAAMNRYKL